MSDDEGIDRYIRTLSEAITQGLLRVDAAPWRESWWGVMRFGRLIRIEYTNGFAFSSEEIRIESLALPIPSELQADDRIPIARLLPRAALALVKGTPEPRSAKLLKSLRK